MKNALILIVVTFGIYSCNPIVNLFFTGSKEDTEGMTHLESKYNSDNQIYKTHRKFIFNVYRIVNYDSLNCYSISYDDTTEINKIALKVIPGNYTNQTKIKWEYLSNDSVVNYAITGLIEDEYQVWTHPPRQNYPFIYTEAAPFPDITFPIEINKTWKSSGVIPKGRYKEIGIDKSKVKYNYKIIDKENLNTPFKLLKDCWKIESKGFNNKIGESLHTFYFHHEYGFVFCRYTLANKEVLILELQDIVSKP